MELAAFKLFIAGNQELVSMTQVVLCQLWEMLGNNLIGAVKQHRYSIIIRLLGDLVTLITRLHEYYNNSSSIFLCPASKSRVQNEKDK